MLHHIGKIGIFMIAAQAMVHFAPGKQYEKYVKSVAGIILLVLFMKPFLQVFGAVPKEPQAAWEAFEKMMEIPDFTAKEPVEGVDAEVVKRAEEEVMTLLNGGMEGEEYQVSGVSIRFGTNRESPQELVLSAVEVRLAKREEKERGEIDIEKITVGEEHALVSWEVFPAYRERFAALLGIEEERVEVKQDGGRKEAF